ncbi:MAG TPA: methyltransferase domain-containing protein, partial [Thermodesulfobacteriota bacterium]|nr:methyltransferase domain-containing protein [Thermodesulfobacteriota bacterium]
MSRTFKPHQSVLFKPADAAGRCRVCAGPFFPEPLLQYRNMPAAAQFLPQAGCLERDRGVDLVLFQCSGCGLVQLGGAPVHYYREVVRAAGISDEMKESRRKQFRGFLEEHGLRGKKVIEIGCGRGEYLAIIKECGTDAYGLEDSEASVAHCVRAGLQASRGFLERRDDEISGAPFDAFAMLNFLEHLPEPNETLRAIHKNLAGGGVGIVEVPNFEMVLRKNLFSEFIGDHLLYFTKETFRTALALNGFETLDCSETWHDYILSARVRRKEKLDVSGFHSRQGSITREIERYLGRFPAGKVAVWGAGHQALAVLSLAGLGGKIRYVVDSAPFKQGRYTPATHIPIVSPETLKTDAVDAVIVMAASYSDEVAGILRREFNPGMDVS